MTQLENRIGWAVAGAVLATTVGMVAFQGASESGDAARVAVMCGPAEQAIVTETSSQVAAGTAAETIVRCVPDAVLQVSTAAAVRPVPATTGVVAIPAVATLTPAPSVPAIPVQATAVPSAVAAQPAVSSRPAAEPRAEVESDGNWQRRALIIGGTAGAGAGLGALVGGKKGAIIGAAAGGGGATLYELLKKRDR